MESRALHTSVALPPPVVSILLYAADGLSKRQGNLTSGGRPRTPNRSEWVPLFIEHLKTTEGISELRILAEEGMRAWGCSSDHLNAMYAAFDDITFKVLSIAALEHFAETSPKMKLAVTAESDRTQTPTHAQTQMPDRHVPQRSYRPGVLRRFHRLIP